MNIGELAKLLGITNVTIRHYEKIGLLRPERDQNGYRQYDDKAIDKLKFIENAKFMGFSLSEINELFSLERQDISSVEIKQKVEAKLADIKARIDLLRQFEKNLTQLNQICDGSRLSSVCPIMAKLYNLKHDNTRRMKSGKA